MNLNITGYLIITVLTSIFSLFVIINSLFNSKRKTKIFSFLIISLSVFLMSLSNLVILLTSNKNFIINFAYVLEASVYIFPAALFHYAVDNSDFNLFKIKHIKYAFYFPSLAIIFYFLISQPIRIAKIEAGYKVYGSLARYLGVFYILPLLIIIIVYVSYDLHKIKKTNYPILSHIVFFSGLLFFTISTVTIRGIGLRLDYNFGFYISALLRFIFFIIIAINAYMEKITLDMLPFSRIFHTIDDCIIITDRKGDIIEINQKMIKTLFGDSLKNNLKRSGFNTAEIKSNMIKFAEPPEKIIQIFKFFESDSLEKLNLDIGCKIHDELKHYNVMAAPIIYSKNKVIGKVAIFRDVSEKKLLQDRLKDESIRDFLTGAYNRRHFYEILDNAIKRFYRLKQPFNLLIIDIDKFKLLNDKYGHLQGDWLLQQLTKILMDNTRSGLDSVVRFGGDEFAVILESSDIEHAKSVCKRIINEYNKIDKKETSLSIGISQYKEGMSQDDLVKEADLLMYEAKTEEGSTVKTPAI